MIADRGGQAAAIHELLRQAPGELTGDGSLDSWPARAVVCIEGLRRGCDGAVTQSKSVLGALAGPAAPYWSDLIHHYLGEQSRGRPPGSADQPLIAPSASMHPEVYWFEQLVALHAVDHLACVSGDGALTGRCLFTADHALEELQPDHATCHPWALHAFLRHARHAPMAEWMLHQARLHLARSPDGLTVLLLREALYLLEIACP